MTLRTQIIGVTLILPVLVVIGMVWVIGDLASDQVRRQIGMSLSDLAVEMADRLDREMDTRIAEVEVLSKLPPLASLSDTDTARVMINHLQDEVPAFSWIGVTDHTGLVVAGTDGILEGKSIAHRPVFQEGIKGGFEGDVHDAVLLAELLPNPSGEPVKFVDVSRPIRGLDGSPAGVFAAHLSWEWASRIEQFLLRDSGSRRNIDLYVVSADGTILLGPDAFGSKLGLPVVDRAQAGGTGWQVETWPDGTEYLTGYAPSDGHESFKGFGWSVLARQKLTTAYAPISDLLIKIVILGGGFALAAALLGWWASIGVTQPLRAMADAADAMRKSETPVFPVIERPRELRTVSTAIKSLIDSLVTKQTELDRMTDKAYHDPLTGIGNRSALERFLARSAVGRRNCAVLSIDLDGFKSVNDRYGHDAGDLVLREVATRLKECVRPDDRLIRQGGDEFVAFLNISRPKDQEKAALGVADRMVASLSAPYEVTAANDPKGEATTETIRIGASVGISLFPRDDDELQTVLRYSDAAMYAAKQAGKGRVRVHSADGPVDPHAPDDDGNADETAKKRTAFA